MGTQVSVWELGEYCSAQMVRRFALRAPKSVTNYSRFSIDSDRSKDFVIVNEDLMMYYTGFSSCMQW